MLLSNVMFLFVCHNNMRRTRRNSVFYTHDNGSRPFRVEILENQQQEGKEDVHVWKEPEFDVDAPPWDETFNKLHPKPEPDYRWVGVERVMVGKSEKNRTTLWGGGHGPKFDGAGFLLDLGERRYVFISNTIFEFTLPFAGGPIVKFVGNVGNNDVPYMYAITNSNAYVLLNLDTMYVNMHPILAEMNGDYEGIHINPYDLAFGDFPIHSKEVWDRLGVHDMRASIDTFPTKKCGRSAKRDLEHMLNQQVSWFITPRGGGGNKQVKTKKQVDDMREQLLDSLGEVPFHDLKCIE